MSASNWRVEKIGAEGGGTVAVILRQVGGSEKRLQEGDTARVVHSVRCPLPPRELENLVCLAEGKTYQEIALERGRSVSTIRTQLHSTYGKLGVTDRAQAVLIAYREGWIELPDFGGAT